MPRLFWKFLFAFWGVLLLAGAAVAVVLTFRAPLAGPHERVLLDAAAATLEHGGVAALQSLLADPRSPGSRRITAVNVANSDFAGNSVDASIAEVARLEARKGTPRELAQFARAPDGSDWVLFYLPASTSSQGELVRQGPPGPPGAPSVAIPLVALMVAGLVFSALLAWYVVAPIRRLRVAFAAAAQGDLKTRVSPQIRGRNDELADLARDFDRMAQQLELVMASQRRLLNDVSHELRSPLARLQAAIGLARQNPAKMEPMLDRIERESGRLDTLVGEILALVRLDVSSGRPGTDRIDLADLVHTVVEDANFEARTHGRRVDFAHDADPIVEGHYESLYRAVENVIRNAVGYTAEGTAVDVSLSSKRVDVGEPRATITVADRGPGVPEDEMEAIFRPFYRASTSIGANGFGLGLAISSRAVTMHGGHIKARSRPGGGLLIDIDLPSLPAEREPSPATA
jgi:two-component system OmpR family sensor kinase